MNVYIYVCVSVVVMYLSFMCVGVVGGRAERSRIQLLGRIQAAGLIRASTDCHYR